MTFFTTIPPPLTSITKLNFTLPLFFFLSPFLYKKILSRVPKTFKNWFKIVTQNFPLYQKITLYFSLIFGKNFFQASIAILEMMIMLLFSNVWLTILMRDSRIVVSSSNASPFLKVSTNYSNMHLVISLTFQKMPKFVFIEDWKFSCSDYNS